MLVYLTSPWIPAEWVEAHGLEPRGVWSAPDLGLAPAALSAGVCAFADSIVSLAEHHPEAAVVFSSHCDQLRRGFDSLPSPGIARRFLFNLPATWQTPAAGRLFDSELERLGRFLIALGGRDPAPGELDALLSQSSAKRARLLEAATHLPARRFAEAVARFHWDGDLRLPGEAAAEDAGERGDETPIQESAEGSRPVPIALVGGPLPQGQWRLLDALEKAGALVALNATEAGERSLPPPCTAGARGQSLGRSCLDQMVDVFQRPNTRLYAWLRERLEARKARGIVLWAYTGCDLWRAEAQSLREACALPVLLLDADEVANGWPRLTGRIEAFLESLRGRPG
jgi:hypothetical protein